MSAHFSDFRTTLPPLVGVHRLWLDNLKGDVVSQKNPHQHAILHQLRFEIFPQTCMNTNYFKLILMYMNTKIFIAKNSKVR